MNTAAQPVRLPFQGAQGALPTLRIHRQDVFAKLRRIARGPQVQEQCEYCSAQLAPTHRHLLELATRKIICACDPCALRFENVIGRWKLIPRDATALPDFQLNDSDWEAFSLPINLAFIFMSTSAGKMVAMYPSPAGATESLVPLDRWGALARANPSLGEMEPDVEALLVNRLGDARTYHVAPIDVCYELVGLIRLNWRGLSGGDLVWREVESFFKRLQERGGPLLETPAAPVIPAPAAPGYQEGAHA
jgi:hypothetical protein